MQQQWPETTGPDGGVHPATGDGTARPEPPPSTGLACLGLVARRLGLRFDPQHLGHCGDSHEPDMATLATLAAGTGFRAKALDADWRHLQDLGRALPAIVALRDGRRLVMVRLGRDGGAPEVELRDPASPEEPLVMLRAAFEVAWSGEVVLLKPRLRAPREEVPFGWPVALRLVRRAGRLPRDLALSGVVLVGLALVPPLLVRALVGDVMGGAAHHTLLAVLLACVIVLLFEGLFTALQARWAGRLGEWVGRGLEGAVMARAMSLPWMPAFRMPPAAVLALGQGASAAREATVLVRAATGGASAVALLPLLVWFNASMAGMLLGCLAVGGAVLGLLGRRAGRAAMRRAAAAADRAAVLAETVRHRGAFQPLRLGGRQRRLWDALTARVARLQLAEAAGRGALDAAANLMAAVLLGAPLVFGAVPGGGSAHPLPAGDLFVFAFAALRLWLGLQDVIAAVPTVAALRGRMAAWRDVMDRPAPAEALHATAPALRGQLRVEGVCFTYPGAPEPALHDVSFTLEAGQVMGLAGRSGAGASTLLALLGRHAEPGDGLIKIDGLDLRAMPRDHLCRQVALVRRDAVLLAGTLGDALRATAPEAPDAALLDALHLAGAGHLPGLLPAGLDTRLDPAAPPFSEGEGQAVLVARALVGRPAVLLLDGATDALPEAEEARLVKRLAAAGHTVVVATQRLATLAAADAVLVLESGTVQAPGRAGTGDRPFSAAPHDLAAMADAMRARHEAVLAPPGRRAA